MYKNQLQELAQRSCFNLPCYACIREGPDHAPRFKASVNFNGEIFESPTYCTTLRQAEHSAAEVALNVLSNRGPSRSLTARVLDETGVYKNLLQETAHRAGLNLPVYTTVRSGPGHVPVFTSTVELAAMNFTGESAKTKKQAEKNAAIAAWSALKTMPNLDSLSKTSKEMDSSEEQDQTILASVLSNFRHPKDQIKAIRKDQNQMRRKMMRGQRDNNGSNASLLYQKWRPMDLLINLVSEGPIQKQKSFVSLLPPPPPRTVSKILPPTSSGFNPIQVIPKLQVTMQEVQPPPLDEHQRDEDEWLYGKSDVVRKPPVLTDHGNQNELTHIRTRLVGPAQQCSSQVGRSIYSGGYHPHRIAPAVQMRSVIPVCAAPPMRHHPPPPLANEIASSSSSAAASSMSTNKVAEVLSASPKLSSEFNKKLQL